MMNTKPYWNWLDKKKQKKLMRKAFLHTVRRIKKLVEIQQEEKIRNSNFLVSAHRKFSHYLHTHARIPNDIDFRFVSLVDYVHPSDQSGNVQKGTLVKIKLQVIVCVRGVKDEKNKKQWYRVVTLNMRKRGYSYGLIVSNISGKDVCVSYMSAEVARLMTN